MRASVLLLVLFALPARAEDPLADRVQRDPIARRLIELKTVAGGDETNPRLQLLAARVRHTFLTKSLESTGAFLASEPSGPRTFAGLKREIEGAAQGQLAEPRELSALVDDIRHALEPASGSPPAGDTSAELKDKTAARAFSEGATAAAELSLAEIDRLATVTGESPDVPIPNRAGPGSNVLSVAKTGRRNAPLNARTQTLEMPKTPDLLGAARLVPASPKTTTLAPIAIASPVPEAPTTPVKFGSAPSLQPVTASALPLDPPPSSIAAVIADAVSERPHRQAVPYGESSEGGGGEESYGEGVDAAPTRRGAMVGGVFVPLRQTTAAVAPAAGGALSLVGNFAKWCGSGGASVALCAARVK